MIASGRRLAALSVGLASLFGAVSAAHAATIFYTVTNVNLSGIFGTVTGGGTFDSAGHSDITLVEHQPPPLPGGAPVEYTYHLTGPADGPGWSNIASQQPPTPCILGGCTSPYVDGSPFPFSFDLAVLTPGTVGAGAEDDLEVYSGTAVITEAAVPEPSAWALMLLGLAGGGVAIRAARRRNPVTAPG